MTASAESGRQFGLDLDQAATEPVSEFLVLKLCFVNGLCSTSGALEIVCKDGSPTYRVVCDGSAHSGEMGGAGGADMFDMLNTRFFADTLEFPKQKHCSAVWAGVERSMLVVLNKAGDEKSILIKRECELGPERAQLLRLFYRKREAYNRDAYESYRRRPRVSIRAVARLAVLISCALLGIGAIFVGFVMLFLDL
jgi:hypothetical protein